MRRRVIAIVIAALAALGISGAVAASSGGIGHATASSDTFYRG